MSLFESIVQKALEVASNSNPEYAKLAEVVLSFIHKQGGVEGIKEKFQSKDMGDLADTWIGNGDNGSLSSEDLVKVFGKKAIGDIAQKAGLDESDAADKIATVLPLLMNGLTPEGKSTGSDLLESGLGLLKDKFF
jgi:uncharacterized protein YidB (DUF937 family)